MNNHRWTIKTLWIGPSLSVIEQLSLTSFIKCGHRVELFTYDEIQNIPEGVILRDGNEILSETKIFKYKARPSYAGFSNWFRYVMLFKEGGVWVDTDVVCLKPFDFDTDLFFGMQQADYFNVAVLGAEPEIEILGFLAKQAEDPNKFLPYDTFNDKRKKLKRKYLQGNHRGNIRWGELGPNGFTKAINYFGYSGRALPLTAFYPIHYTCWPTIFDQTYPSVDAYFPDSYAIHLWNEMMRGKKGFDKDKTYHENSLIEELKRRYLD